MLRVTVVNGFISIEIDVRGGFRSDLINDCCDILVPMSNAFQLGPNLLNNKLCEYVVGRCWHPDDKRRSMGRPVEPCIHMDTRQCYTFEKVGRTCSLTGACPACSHKAISFSPISTIASDFRPALSRTLSRTPPLALCDMRLKTQEHY